MKNQTQIPSRRTLIMASLIAGLAQFSQAAGPNIVIFIGDGMGFEHVQAGRLYQNGSDATPLTFETLPYRGQAVTKLPDGTITDSATAGTALATGYQHPANGVISMGANNSIKTSILELAKAKGLKTGIITTDSISGATPGAFGAHEPDRSYEADIRLDYLMDDLTYPHAASRPNVLFGGGFNDPFLIPGRNSTYVAIASSLGYSFVDTASGLSELSPANYALGLFGSSWSPMDPFVANNPGQPRLPDMVNKALSLMQNNNGAGFFLMVEGALIDKLSHSSDPNFTPEVVQLDLAVQEAFAWASQSGQSLLVIVTADHETGGVNVPDEQAITPGTIPEMTFSTTGHTAADVPVYANWPAGLQSQTIDNTELFYLMEDYLESGKPPQITGLKVSGITETDAVAQWNTTELSDSQVALSGITQPFVNTVRVATHTLSCTGLEPGTTYTLTATSKDLAGFTGTATAEFTTLAPSPDAIVNANPVFTRGTLAGNYDAVTAPNDGLSQTITEVASGVGSGLQVEYTMHTPVALSQIASLQLSGLASWTLKDGSSDSLITEVRVLGPGDGVRWQQISLNTGTPFQAVPPSSYVDPAGNIVIRFTDGALIKRERKDTLTVDYLVGKVEVTSQTLPAVTAPANLAATPGSASIALTWNDSANEAGYDIWRSTAAAAWVFLGSLPANETSFTDAGLTASTTYRYVVRAFNNQSCADSALVEATTGIAATQLFVPENLTARVVKGVVNLVWTDTNTSETAYQVLRSGSVVATLPANSTKYSDSQVTKGVTYEYQVRAIDQSTAGPVSSPVSVTVR